MLKGKYVVDCSVLKVVCSASSSYFLKGLCRSWEVLLRGIRKAIGNGKSTKDLLDPWIPRSLTLRSCLPRLIGVNIGFQNLFLRRVSTKFKICGNFFLTNDVDEIVRILLSHLDRKTIGFDVSTNLVIILSRLVINVSLLTKLLLRKTSLLA